MLEDLAALVEVESPSADTAATLRCGEVLDDQVHGHLGVRAQRIEVDGVSHLRWSFGGAPRILLLGHLDTVWPLGTLARWPFAVDGDRATGPGCFDMKAGLVQTVHALTRLDSLEGLILLVTADEELGSPSSADLVRRSAAGMTAALVMEPSAGGALKTERKGVGVYRFTLHGLAAHAGLEPWAGRNAAVAAAHVVLAAAGLDDLSRGTTVTTTVVAAGTTTNTVPALASVAVDVRATTVSEQERIDAALRALDPVVEGVRLELAGGINRAPLEAARSAGLFALAREEARALGWSTLKGVAVGGGSDGNLTAGAGVPTLDGLGAVGDGAHAEGEHVHVPSLAHRRDLLAALIGRLQRA